MEGPKIETVYLRFRYPSYPSIRLERTGFIVYVRTLKSRTGRLEYFDYPDHLPEVSDKLRVVIVTFTGPDIILGQGEYYDWHNL